MDKELKLIDEIMLCIKELSIFQLETSIELRNRIKSLEEHNVYQKSFNANLDSRLDYFQSQIDDLNAAHMGLRSDHETLELAFTNQRQSANITISLKDLK